MSECPKGCKRKPEERKHERGQALLEYLLLVCLVTVATVGVVRVFQKTIKVNFTKSIMALQGDRSASPAHDRVQESTLRKSDFRDFMNGAVQRSSHGGSSSD